MKAQGLRQLTIDLLEDVTVHLAKAELKVKSEAQRLVIHRIRGRAFEVLDFLHGRLIPPTGESLILDPNPTDKPAARETGFYKVKIGADCWQVAWYRAEAKGWHMTTAMGLWQDSQFTEIGERIELP